MKSHLVAAVLLFAPAASPAVAGPLACPDLATAMQVGNCPDEQELKYSFTAHCSDNARLYKPDDLCEDFERYRRAKTVALWEAGHGSFHAYLSCELPVATIRAAKASSVAVSRQGGVTRVVCSYERGIAFTHRAKGHCKVQGSADCAANPAACKVTCD